MENIYYYTKSIDIYLNIYVNNVLTQKKNDAENFIKSPRKPSNLPNFLMHANFM